MKKFGVYILKCNNGRYYTGSTDNLKRRLAEHQSGKTKSIKYLLPVQVVAFIECGSLAEARKLELQIKRMKSRAYIEQLILAHPFNW